MYSLTRHQNPTKHKQTRNRVELPHRPLRPGPQWQIIQDPALADPVRHESSDGERGGDRSALEVSALARSVLGDVGYGDVEARETRETAEHEEGEEDVVDGSAEPEGECGGGGGDAEGYLRGEELVSYFLVLSFRGFVSGVRYQIYPRGVVNSYHPDKKESLKLTRSASESSSWPIRLLFFLQRATLPSMKSKKRPNGMKASAAHMLPSADGGPRQYRMDEKTDMMPQKPVCVYISSPQLYILFVFSFGFVIYFAEYSFRASFWYISHMMGIERERKSRARMAVRRYRYL